MAPGAMFVHEAGSPRLPAVVFLHGAGASGLMWRKHTARLSSTFRCVVPDLPGFGRSKTLPFLSRAVTADLVAELIAQRVPSGRAHVVGLSWGGGIAHTLLDRQSALVDRAVIDGAGLLTSRSGPLMLAGVAAVSPFLHTGPVTAMFANIIGMDEVGRADLRAASPAAFRRAFVEGFRSGVSRKEIRARSPLLLMAGERESAVRPSNSAQAALMPQAVARYAPGLGHGWLARATELHVRAVEAWLTEQPLPDALLPEVPSPAALRRMLRELGDGSLPLSTRLASPRGSASGFRTRPGRTA